MRRVLVTGANGFVGANLVRKLLLDGNELHVVLRPNAQRWRLDEVLPRIRIHETDLTDDGGVRAAVRLARPDWIFSLAAHGGYSDQVDGRTILASNTLGAMTLLDASLESGFEAFVHTGSSSEYGYKDHPAREDDVLEPNSTYAVTKAAATHYCQFVARSCDVNVVVLRLYSVYGPYERPTRFIPTLIIRGLERRLPPLVDPSTTRDFVHVDDTVTALIRVASTRALPRGTVLNVCSGTKMSVRDVVTIAKSLLEISDEPDWKSMPARPWDTKTWVGDPQAIRERLGWEPAYAFEDGFGATLRWLRDNPRWLAFYREALAGVT
jgi:nucleoside-diphosphate-sugar epimerase